MENYQEILIREYLNTKNHQYEGHLQAAVYKESISDHLKSPHLELQPTPRNGNSKWILLGLISLIILIALNQWFLSILLAIYLLIMILIKSKKIDVVFTVSLSDKNETLDYQMNEMKYYIGHFEAKNRPRIGELEQALKYLWEIKLRNGEKNTPLKNMVTALGNIDTNLPINEYISKFNSENWLENFIGKHALYRYGTKTIKLLENPGDDEEKIHLIKNIAEQSTMSLENIYNLLVCTRCFSWFSKHTIKSDMIHYYGCRVCEQNREYISCKGDINAILNKNMNELYLIANEELWVNWLFHRKIFDFDRVEIINATDKDVELFCIQVGNDMDEIRQPKYKQMECIVKCELDPNTMKILENTFGEVKVI